MRKNKLAAILGKVYANSHSSRRLPLHSWEAHSLAHPGEAHRTFVVSIIIVVGILALTLLFFLGSSFVGKGITGMASADIGVICDFNCIDSDGDGYVTGLNCCDVDGALLETDANDNDATCWINLTFYRDYDKDGKGSFSAIPEAICTSGVNVPSGYSSNNDDCFDSNPTKECDAGKHCVAEEQCDWICDGCILGEKRCSGNFIEECKIQSNDCTRWTQTFCGEKMNCLSSKKECVSEDYCTQNKDCLNKGGYCHNGLCKKLVPAEDGITIGLITPGYNIQDTAQKITSGENYLVQVQVRPTEDLPDYYVHITLTHYNEQSTEKSVESYWVAQSALGEGELGVVTINHLVPQAWGKLKVKTEVFDLWSPLGNDLLIETEEKVYEIY